MSYGAHPGDHKSRLWGTLTTFRRPDRLVQTLDRLRAQSDPPDVVVVVDNGGDAGSAVAEAQRHWPAGSLHYLAMPSNVGPAGGVAAGMRWVLDRAAATDWVMVLDDDDPPTVPTALADLRQFARDSLAADPACGGVGLVGARFDRRAARTRRVPTEELHGRVPVETLGGNQLPMFRVAAVRHVGPFREDLFFGCEELEFCLRLEDAHYHLYAHGDLHRQLRQRLGHKSTRRPSWRLAPPTWRRYYGLRNRIWIARRWGGPTAAVRVSAEVMAKALANGLRDPRLARQHVSLTWGALRDGWHGRLGRTLEPTLVDERLPSDARKGVSA